MHIVDLRFCFCFFFGGGLLARKSIDNVDFAAGIVETIAKIAVTGACETFDRAERARGRVVRPEASCGRKRLAAKPFSWWPSVLVCARGGDVLGAPRVTRRAARRAGARCAGARCAARQVGARQGMLSRGVLHGVLEMPRSTLGALLCASGAARDASEGGAPKCENLCKSGSLTMPWCCGALKVRKTVFGPRAGQIARSGARHKNGRLPRDRDPP